MKPETLDEKRIEHLIEGILSAVRQNYREGPINRDRVYEALNALAFSAAWIIKGAGNDPAAWKFFQKAFEINLGD